MTDDIQLAMQKLGVNRLLIASSSEPYLHYYHGGIAKGRGAAGGVATAFDSLLQATDGTWIALGLGSADKDTVDKNNRVRVPPENPKYTLRRVFITKKQEEGFLSESSNSALWPLSHNAYVRPHFQLDAWEQYREVNRLMAEAIATEADDQTLVWINDYHLSLCAGYLKKIKPNIQTGFFWHIPWPAAEIFNILPWKKEILEGLLQNDLIGFHTTTYAENFSQSVRRVLQTESPSPVSKKTPTTGAQVRVIPIGIDEPSIRRIAKQTTPEKIKEIRAEYQATDRKLIVGVDRMDYTKGITDKFKALDLLFTRRPDLLEKMTLVQIAAPSRINLPEYAHCLAETLETAEKINWKYAIGNWQPIQLKNAFFPLSQIIPLYKTADVCLVTSLQDGMNLVSKEFIAANPGNGSLVLSTFAGSSEELGSAILVNPFLPEDIANGIEQALAMDENEKKTRMNEMKKIVADNNVFTWATSFMHQLLEPKPPHHANPHHQ